MKELYRKHTLFFLVLITVAAGFLVWYFSAIFICILVAGVISIIGAPLVNLLDRIKIKWFSFPHTLSVVITLLVMLSLFFGMFSLFVPLVVREANMIGNIDGKQLLDYFREDLTILHGTLVRYGILQKGITIEEALKQAILRIIDFGVFSNVLSSLISFTGSFFFNLFSILFLSFFFLKDQRMLPRFILAAAPSAYSEQIRNVMSKSANLLSRYFIGLLVQILLNIVTYSLALAIVGVQNPLAIGFFTGVIIIVPYLGGIIAMITGVLLGVTGVISAGDYAMVLPMAIRIVAAMAIVQAIDNNVIAPLIQGKSMKAHPVEIFLVVIAAASLGGIIGMVVAVPAYGFIKIVAREFLSNFRLVRHLSEK